MKKVVFGITSLNAGGAERVLIDLVNKLTLNYDITIFTFYGNGDFETQLDSNVKIIHMVDKRYEDLSWFQRKTISFCLLFPSRRKKLFDKYIGNNYDVFVPFLEGPVTWIMSKAKGKKIAWVHNDISLVFGDSASSLFKKKMNFKCYQKYDELVFVSNDNLDKFKKVFPNNNVNKRVIYNYINSDLVKEKASEMVNVEIKDDVISFVQVSRLVSQKAVSRLIDVHKRLIDDGYKHRIYVVGDGPLKDELKEKINELCLDDTFILLGRKDNPYPYIKKGDVFMLTSYYEGFPMVLLEAKVLGKYILITDSAARETVSDYGDAMIVSNDSDGIYNGIKELILNPPKKNSSLKFSNEEILNEVKEVLGEDDDIDSNSDL